MFSDTSSDESGNSSDSESAEHAKKKKKIPVSQIEAFSQATSCSSSTTEKNISNNNCDLFTLDSRIDSGSSIPKISSSLNNRYEKLGNICGKSNPMPIMDKDVREALEKAVIKPGFEQKSADELKRESYRKARARRKMERERTKGAGWFHMPATEMTDERKRDLQLLQMRDAIDSKTHYKNSDKAVLPKYFEMGRIVSDPSDFYSRITKKEQKKTMVDELLADYDIQRTMKKRYTEIKNREMSTKRGAFRRGTFPRKRKR